MHRSIRGLLFSFVTPALLCAQQVRRELVFPAPPVPVLSLNSVVERGPSSFIDLASFTAGRAPAVRWSPVESRGRRTGRFALRGSLVGGVMGVVAGVAGSRAVGCGCSDAQKAIAGAVWIGSLGAASGAVAGALIGAASHSGGR
ncbi:MAG TPA: hypothetical protein VGP25_01025 [Gemmatimonadaceae bacterium]|nr:hypothetical protein [Gemmatimonadaceae bacterium]